MSWNILFLASGKFKRELCLKYFSGNLLAKKKSWSSQYQITTLPTPPLTPPTKPISPPPPPPPPIFPRAGP